MLLKIPLVRLNRHGHAVPPCIFNCLPLRWQPLQLVRSERFEPLEPVQAESSGQIEYGHPRSLSNSSFARNSAQVFCQRSGLDAARVGILSTGPVATPQNHQPMLSNKLR